MVFSLPQFPLGVFSFIDTSPPIVYPSKPTPLHRKRSNTTTAVSTPRSHEAPTSLAPPPPFPKLRHQASKRSLHQPQGGQGKETKTLAASMSTLDLGTMWQPLAGGGLEERRRSISQLDGAKPVRPGHRRCQSAISSPRSPPPPTLSTYSQSPSSDFGPRPSLQEYSRKSISSASATSLPTLAEMGQGMDAEYVGVSASGPVTCGGRVSIPPSPIVRPRARLSRGSSVISLSSSPSSSLLHTPGEDTRHRSLVPRPQPPAPEARKYSSMPPPPLHPSPASITYSPSKTFHRPRPSRTQSFRDIDNSLQRPLHSRRASVDSLGSVEVSDVAVMATWSFPASPSPEKKTPTKLDVGQDDNRGRRLGTSNRLRERLKNLSELDTGWRPSVSSPASSLSGRTSASSMDSTDTVIRPSRPLPSHLTSRHRHTHSSPNVLFQVSNSATGSPGGAMGPPSQPLLPPPRPQRRTTTTRLRNPNPLSMHTQSTAGLHRASSVGAGGKSELSSSPGSMVSDTTTCPSPTSSIRSLPAGNMTSIPAIHLNGESAVAKAESRWWAAIGSFRRTRSKSNLLSTDEVSVAKSVAGTEDQTEEFGLDLDDNKEEYIDMDHM
ncbi:hypothetical protein IAR50_003025 [Cryptococcus sp. DSM 104548]